ncbi:hypothetical protein VOLCADRAFT_103376 [Volvox carteri f. nagariensis]|uniref:Uncharacterized protein n=1 Tax=Volvox carteri f. nagariensis TaxID=3068 RepID=D8TLH4_VOLCA|nr:uncharacterized protein VOLCADRAFT_103376 [Volvox carteri f. nagariensis]EFJ51874.1 hypothetical protein VOLCADRAFT_103376 [Volvox carteri f. nagariensis]|eukprot:XP_002947284.1 hypothetical protein VOLCADRAFT_103376 [Volvox carteri f. nagariensis]
MASVRGARLEPARRQGRALGARQLTAWSSWEGYRSSGGTIGVWLNAYGIKTGEANARLVCPPLRKQEKKRAFVGGAEAVAGGAGLYIGRAAARPSRGGAGGSLLGAAGAGLGPGTYAVLQVSWKLFCPSLSAAALYPFVPALVALIRSRVNKILHAFQLGDWPYLLTSPAAKLAGSRGASDVGLRAWRESKRDDAGGPSQEVHRARRNNSAVCFYEDPADKKLKLHILWDELKSQKLADCQWLGGPKGKGYAELTNAFGDTTYGDLEARPLQYYSSTVVPFRRVPCAAEPRPGTAGWQDGRELDLPGLSLHRRRPHLTSNCRAAGAAHHRQRVGVVGGHEHEQCSRCSVGIVVGACHSLAAVAAELGGKPSVQHSLMMQLVQEVTDRVAGGVKRQAETVQEQRQQQATRAIEAQVPPPRRRHQRSLRGVSAAATAGRASESSDPSLWQPCETVCALMQSPPAWVVAATIRHIIEAALKIGKISEKAVDGDITAAATAAIDYNLPDRSPVLISTHCRDFSRRRHCPIPYSCHIPYSHQSKPRESDQHSDSSDTVRCSVWRAKNGEAKAAQHGWGAMARWPSRRTCLPPQAAEAAASAAVTAAASWRIRRAYYNLTTLMQPKRRTKAPPPPGFAAIAAAAAAATTGRPTYTLSQLQLPLPLHLQETQQLRLLGPLLSKEQPRNSLVPMYGDGASRAAPAPTSWPGGESQEQSTSVVVDIIDGGVDAIYYICRCISVYTQQLEVAAASESAAVQCTDGSKVTQVSNNGGGAARRSKSHSAPGLRAAGTTAVDSAKELGLNTSTIPRSFSLLPGLLRERPGRPLVLVDATMPLQPPKSAIRFRWMLVVVMVVVVVVVVVGAEPEKVANLASQKSAHPRVMRRMHEGGTAGLVALAIHPGQGGSAHWHEQIVHACGGGRGGGSGGMC